MWAVSTICEINNGTHKVPENKGLVLWRRFAKPLGPDSQEVAVAEIPAGERQG